MPSLWDDIKTTGATDGKATGNWQASGVEIDSRRIKAGDVFVAIKGEQHDGHDFIEAAAKAGAVACVVSRAPKIKMPYVLVEDTLAALTAMAKDARARTGAAIIGITGSVGKTSSKEMLRLALAAHGSTFASSGNYNNHIGLPLCLANLPEDTKYAVLEMGMNHAGEIAHLSAIARPQVALITNVEAVHMEFFDSESAIADAKAEIFSGMVKGGAAVLNRDNKHFPRLAEAASKRGLKVLSCGTGEQADCRLLNRDKQITAQIYGEAITYTLPVLGAHMAQNSLMVLACVKALGLDVKKSAAALAAYQEPKGRGKVLPLTMDAGTVTVIDDSYNASPVSMRAAFAKTQEVWKNQGSKGRKIAVLGDMLELGKDSRALHEALAPDAVLFDLVFAAGELMYYLYAALPPEKKAAHAGEAVGLVPLLTAALKAGDVVLIKGSNGSRMHAVAAALKEMYPSPETLNVV